MKPEENGTAIQLMRAFMMFERAEWKGRTIGGFKPSEVRILILILRYTLSGVPGMTVSELSRWLQVTSPTVTQLVNGLEQRGCVLRVPDEKDRRTARVQLTERGKEVAIQRREDIFSAFNGLIDHLGEEDSRKLLDLLKRTYEYFKEKDQSGIGGEDV